MKKDDEPSNVLAVLFVYIRSLGADYRDTIVKALKKLKSALAQESAETKEMLEIYFRFSQGKASPKEMAQANAQFRDLLRTSGLGVFAVLPFAPVTIPLIVKIGRRFGIEILPSSFRPKGDK